MSKHMDKLKVMVEECQTHILGGFKLGAFKALAKAT